MRSCPNPASPSQIAHSWPDSWRDFLGVPLGCNAARGQHAAAGPVSEVDGSRTSGAVVRPVQRRLECLELAVVLSQWPLLGKSGRQFDVWRRAVELWVAYGGACDALSPIAAELRGLHRSIAPVECPVDITKPALAAFLAGFASAEAHFGVTDHGSTSFVINLREDVASWASRGT